MADPVICSLDIPPELNLKIIGGPGGEKCLFIFGGKFPEAQTRAMLLLAAKVVSSAAKSLPEGSQRSSIEASAETLKGWSATT